MTTREKLDLQINTPTTVELLFDTPITGESKYGPYYMYAVSVEGREYSYFPPEEVHDQLKVLKKGNSAMLTRLAAQRGNKLVTLYDVKVLKQTAPAIPERTLAPLEEDSNPTIRPDNLYSIMLQSYKDALEIKQELHGLPDAQNIAISLFIARSRVNGNGYGG